MSSKAQPLHTAESLPRLLSRAYAAALGLVATLGLLFAWGLAARIDEQVDDYGVVNRAGYQRGLSQRIAALAPALVHEGPADPVDARDRFLATLAQLREGHALLAHGEAAPARMGSALAQHYFGVPAGVSAEGPGHDLETDLHRFFASCERLLELTARRSPLAGPVAAHVRAEALGPLLEQLDTAVRLHQEQAAANLRKVMRYHGFATAMLLCLLALEALLIFRPLARYIGRQSARLAYAASHDPLTGLSNRSAFDAALGKCLRAGEPVGLAMFDLDGFKQTNDSEGHVAGDAVLVAAAERLRSVAAPGDVVARLGGDEFAWVLRQTADFPQARQRLEALLERLHEPVQHEGRLLNLGATAGIAFAPADADDPDTLVRAADAGLIDAKRRSRGSIGTPPMATPCSSTGRG